MGREPTSKGSGKSEQLRVNGQKTQAKLHNVKARLEKGQATDDPTGLLWKGRPVGTCGKVSSSLGSSIAESKGVTVAPVRPSQAFKCVIPAGPSQPASGIECSVSSCGELATEFVEHPYRPESRTPLCAFHADRARELEGDSE